MFVNACLPILTSLIVTPQMYLIGGYAYTPEELRRYFAAKGHPLHEVCIGAQASQYLDDKGLPYSVKACLYKDELVFLFADSYILVTPQTVNYRFTETPNALKMKNDLNLDKPFVTAVY